MFDFKILANQSFLLLKSNFWSLFQACVVVMVAILAFAFVLASFYPLESLNDLPAQQQGILDIAMIVIVAPLSAGLYMMGVNIARKRPVKVSDLFHFVSWVLPLALAQLLVSLLIQIGLILFIIPGIYLLVATTFTLPLIADKKVGVLQAVMTSCRTVNQYLLSFIILFTLFLVMFLLSIFTFGLAFFVIMPFYFVVLGVLYTTLFDTAGNQQVNANVRQESTFDA